MVATLIAVTAILATVYYFVNPMEAEWMPKCPVHILTGLDCPGCGSQRAVYALLHGDIPTAVASNAILLFMIPFILALGAAEFLRDKRPGFYRLMSRPAVIYGLLAIVVVWAVVRNLLGC